MKRVILIGDVHTGSNYSVFPLKFKNPESGNIVEANEWQAKLYEKWEEMAKEFSPVDILILTGDLIEGVQGQERFHTLTLQNVQHQAQAFLELMKLWKYEKLYVVRGTPYHVEVEGIHAEEWIARQLNAVQTSKWGERYSVIDLGIKIEKVDMHVAHHVGVSLLPHYQFTPLVREAWLSKLYNRYYGNYNIIVRSHLHYVRIAQVADDFLVMTTPTWQLPTPYQKRRSHFVFPDLGIIGIDINGSDYAIFMRLIHDIKPHKVFVDGDEQRGETD